MVKRALLAGLLAVLTIFGSELFGQTLDDFCVTQQHPDLQSMLTWDSAAISTTAEPLSGKTRSGGEEFFNSLLIPGWGQLKKGNKLKAYAFFAAEVTLITSLIAFKSYQGWLEDDYRTFAGQHSGISGNRSHQFYVNIGNWQNRDAYNEQRLMDRQFDQMYTSSADDWSWDSEENRSSFKSMRLTADRTGQKTMITVGVLLLNHLLSAVDASGKSGSRRNLAFSPNDRGGITFGMSF